MGFVGRRRELAELHNAVEQARQGRGRLVLISGEPGIGKTTLAERLVGDASGRGVAVHWGRCWEAGGAPPYWPWVQVLREAVRNLDPAAIVARAGARAARLVELDPSLSMFAAAGEADPDAHPERARFELFDAVSTVLRCAAERRPTVAIIDDLHAADEPSLHLLGFVGRTLVDSGLVVIGTYRPEDVRARPEVAPLVRSLARDARVLSLTGFDRDEVAEVIRIHLGTDPPAGTLDAIHATTEGNPFFVDGIARSITGSDTRLRVPEGVRAGIAERVDRVPAPTAELLAVASVFGRDVPLGLLAAVTGHDETTITSLLEPAVTLGLMRLDDAPDQARFSHALVRDALYEDLGAARRARLHRACGEALERARDAAERPAEIAHHFAQAARIGAAKQAVRYARLAAARSIAMLAYEEAIAQLERARTCAALDDDAAPRDRVTIDLELADALRRAGRTAAAEDAYAEAAQLALDAGDDTLHVAAVLGYAGVPSGGVLTAAWTPDQRLAALLESALARASDDEAVRARLLAYLAANLHFTNRREESIGLAEEAVRLAERSGDEPTIAFCLIAQHLAIWSPWSAHERLRIADRVVEIAERTGPLELLMQGHVWRHTDLAELGRMREAFADADAYVALAAQSRLPQHAAYAELLLGARAMFAGDPDAAVEHARRSHAYGRERGDYTIEGSAIVQLGEATLEAGRLHEAYEIFDAFDEPTTHRTVIPRLHALLGRRDEAIAGLAPLVDGEVLFEQNAFWTSFVALATETVAELGDARAAATLYDAMLPKAGHVSTSGRNGIIYLSPFDRMLGRCALVAGRLDDAVKHLRDALGLCERSRPCPAWEGWTLRDLSLALEARGRGGDAAESAELLEQARRIAATHGLGRLRQIVGPPGERDEVAAAMDAGRAEPAAGGAAFFREGDVWSVAFGDDAARIRDMKGLGYLATLLANPHREIAALALVAGDGSAAAATTGIEMLDEEARGAYRRRLAALETEAAEARAFGDDAGAERADKERDAILQELRAATGLGGRSRESGSAAERARVNVTKSIRAALDRIRVRVPAAGRHLDATVKTGLHCEYSPDPANAPAWRL